MQKEYEYRYYGYNKDDIIKKINELGFKNIKQNKLMKNIILDNNTKTYHRLRTFDDNNFTYTQKKQKFSKDFDDEIEIKIVDSSEKVILDMLKNLKLTEKYRVEKIRDIWKLNDIEIVFDTYPGTPEYCEIETKNLDELHHIEKKLNMKQFRFKGGMKLLMKKEFGINSKKITNISFDNISNIRLLVTKNKEKFDIMFENYL